jgi:murein DD-endopeptidase MepM/ murein hydrolase activator NlpD
MRRIAAKVVAEPPPSTPQAPRAADLRVEIHPGEGFAAALLRSGISGLDAALAEKAGGRLSGSAALWLGKKVGLSARALDRLELRTGPGRKLVIEREGEQFVRLDLVEAVDATPVRIRLDGGPGLGAGLVNAGLPREMRDEVLDRVSGEPLAAIDVIAAHEATASASHYGELLYVGAHMADGSVRRWVGERGGLRPLGSVEAPSSRLLRPLAGPVTSRPGLRFHPILRFLRWHRGTDFAAPSGAPVQAALDGRVTAAGRHGGYGQTVRIAHGDGTMTLYAHLSEINVASGQAVARGAVIGKVGSSGLATGPHLHFEWQRAGSTLRPDFSTDQVAGGEGEPAQRAAVQALLSAPFRLPPGRRYHGRQG